MKKRLLCSMLLGCFMFCGVNTGIAGEKSIEKKETITVNGEKKEVKVVMINDRKLISLRDVCEVLDANVDYVDGKIILYKQTNFPAEFENVKSINAVLEVKPTEQGGADWGQVTYVQYGYNSVDRTYISGVGSDIALQKIDNTTYCPIRRIANLLCYNVDVVNNEIILTTSLKQVR